MAMNFQNPGSRLTTGNRYAQMLGSQRNVNNGTTQGGLAHVLRNGLAGYQVGNDQRKEEARQKSMASALSALLSGASAPAGAPPVPAQAAPVSAPDFDDGSNVGMDPSGDMFSGLDPIQSSAPQAGAAAPAAMPQTAPPPNAGSQFSPQFSQMVQAIADGGNPGAAMQLAMQERARMQGVSAADAARLQKNADARDLYTFKKETDTEFPGSPSGRAASGIQYKVEYDRILRDEGPEAAQEFLQNFVNQPWLDFGDRQVPRAGAGTPGGPEVSVPNELPPAQTPEAKRANAEAVVTGGALGDAKEALAAADASLPRLEQSVLDLKKLGETATYTALGQATNYMGRQLGFDPSEGATGRVSYVAHVKNNILPLLRQTFGAAFTATEGDSLLATLGDPDMHPKEKAAVLDAFIENKRADLETMRRRVGEGADGNDPLGIR